MTIVHALLRKQTGFGMARAFLKIRVIGYDLIKLLPPQVLILLNRVEVQCKSVEIGLKWVLLRMVHHEGDGNHFENVLVLNVANFVQIVIQLVFLGQCTVELEVVHEVFLAVFAQEVEPDGTWEGTPLEVEETRFDAVNFMPMSSRFHDPLHQRTVIALEQYVSVPVILCFIFEIFG